MKLPGVGMNRFTHRGQGYGFDLEDAHEAMVGAKFWHPWRDNETTDAAIAPLIHRGLSVRVRKPSFPATWPPPAPTLRPWPQRGIMSSPHRIAPSSDPRGGSTKAHHYCRKAGQIIGSELDFLNGAFALVNLDSG